MLSDLKFLDNLKSFDKDNIPGPTMKRIRERYISDRDFVPDKVKNVSTACEGLCKWVRAMDIYDRVAKIVAPKQQALAAAEAELADQMEKLNAKRAELQVILDKLQGLNDFFAEKSKQKKNLEDEIDNCEKKLDRCVAHWPSSFKFKSLRSALNCFSIIFFLQSRNAARRPGR